ncbi:uncharacterized protein LOC119441692 [Dermacentor silvarum]|uniref:uncharacterized protein LOC119441692 n=1 Tax=Dermacentor silvarum TaxID=543639 RepID=UPI001898FB36|nr:uncharacterized protein LOC119441692 [Dermacentor silvarum]XP_049519061.1 uncharacterized protein LOC119441692 [Dermacentor silvarum]
MKVTVSFLVVILLVTASYGSPAYEKDEVKEDDATAQYWKKPVGYLLEMIAKWLQKSAEGSPASYAAEDDAGLPQDATIEHIRKVAQLLNKVADAVEKGEKVDLFA